MHIQDSPTRPAEVGVPVSNTAIDFPDSTVRIALRDIWYWQRIDNILVAAVKNGSVEKYELRPVKDASASKIVYEAKRISTWMPPKENIQETRRKPNPNDPIGVDIRILKQPQPPHLDRFGDVFYGCVEDDKYVIRKAKFTPAYNTNSSGRQP
jgi:hypothetical protein